MMNTFLKKIQNFIKYKAINFYLFFLLFLIVLVFPVILNPKFLINISGLEWLKRLYSIEIKEEWLGYLGNVMAGILPLGIIFYNEKEAKRQRKQFIKERRTQQKQFNKQLELQEKYKKQEFYVKKFDKEKTLAYELLMEFDKKIYSDFLNLNVKFLDLINNKENYNRNDFIFASKEIVEKIYLKRSEIVDKINTNMGLIASLGWRVKIEDKDTPEFYQMKSNCYHQFKKLHNILSRIIEILTKISSDLEYTSNKRVNEDEIEANKKEEIETNKKEEIEVIDKRVNKYEKILKKLILSHDKKFNETLDIFLIYFTFIENCLIDCKFDELERKIENKNLLKNPQ